MDHDQIPFADREWHYIKEVAGDLSANAMYYPEWGNITADTPKHHFHAWRETQPDGRVVVRSELWQR